MKSVTCSIRYAGMCDACSLAPLNPHTPLNCCFMLFVFPVQDVEKQLDSEWESPAYLSYLLESFENRPILSPGRAARVTVCFFLFIG